MEELEFLGVGFSKDQLINWRNKFDVLKEGDDLCLVSKKVFEHGEDVGVFNNFKYRYVIMVYGADYGLTVESEESPERVAAECYGAYIVPEMEFIHESKIESLQGLYGLDHLTIDEVKKALSLADLAQEGYSVCLGEEIVEAKEEWNEDILNGFATALETVDYLLGFYLDQPFNMMGMTGWDFLEMAMSEKDIANFVYQM